MTHEGPRLSRRDALRTIGAGSALSVATTTVSTSSAASSSSSGGSDPGRQYGCTVRQTVEAERKSPCTTNQVSTSHTLSYLNVSWDAFGAPGDADTQGCWRHTFALSGIGAAHSPDGTYRPGLPYGSFSVNVPTVGDHENHPAERAGAPPTPTATAVAARRSPPTYDFVDRKDLELYLEQRDVAPRDVASTDLTASELHQEFHEERSALAGDPDTLDSAPLSLASTALGVAADASTVEGFSEFQREVGRTSIALGLLGVADEYLDVFQVDDGPRVDRGFASAFPREYYDQDDTLRKNEGQRGGDNYVDDCGGSGVFHSTGCHYVLFDVLEAPGDDHVSAVDVVSGFDHLPGTDDEGPSAGWSIVLNTAAPNGDPSGVTGKQRFTADIEASDHVSDRELTEVTN